jgi:hypothetical protein
VQLQNAPTVTGTISINGAFVTKTTTVPAQRTELTFATTTTNQHVNVLLSGVTYPSSADETLYIVKPNGEKIDELPITISNSTHILDAVGTYTLAVYGRGAGSLTFRLTSP